MVTIKKPNECKNCIWFDHHGKGCHNYNCYNQSEYDEYKPEKLLRVALEAGATVKKTKDSSGGIYLNDEKLKDNDIYECLFNPKITNEDNPKINNGDIIRQKSNEKLALFIVNITHLSPTWNYQDVLSWLNEEYIANKEITNEK